MSAVRTRIGSKEDSRNALVSVPTPLQSYLDPDVQRSLVSLAEHIVAILAVLPAPGSVVDNAVPRFLGTTGLIEDTGLFIDDSNFLSGAAGVGIGGATPDATNRLSANTPAVLFNRETDDIQVKLNKAAAGDTASFLFQTAFSGRAEIGLVGDDDFQFKVSPDGSSFITGIRIDKDDGAVTLPITLSVGGNGAIGGNLNVTGTGAFGGAVTVLDEAYNATNWNGSLQVPTKNAVRDYLELLTGTTLPATYQPLDSTLTALAAYNTNGLLTQTAADTFTGRTITGTTEEITVTNGNGVAGNPVISMPAALTFTGKTITGGTFSGPSLSGTVALASGAIFNWNAGDVTLTHSANALAFAGASNGYSFDALISTTGSLSVLGSIELGHASDTTLARSSAGNVTIEGNIIYRAGGTDVPVADGGTGISSATAYGTILAGTTSTGAFQVASPGTSGQVLTSNGASAAPTYQTPPGAGPQIQAQVATNTGATAYTLASSIPSTVSLIWISFVDVSTNSNVNGLIQIGDSGGFETSGYNSFIEATALNEASATDGFIFWMNTSGSNYTGIMQLMRQGSTNRWVQTTLGNVTGAEAQMGGGWKDLSDSLDRIQLLAVGGTATFDAGTVSVTYM